MQVVRFALLSVVLGAWIATTTRGQTTVPAVTQGVGAQTVAVGGAPLAIDLRAVFGLPGVSGPIAQFDTVLGKFNVELLSAGAPRHVTNFLSYVESGAYSNTFFHRSAAFTSSAISIIQGGGFRLPVVNGTVGEVPKVAPIALEYNYANARGTLAAARTADINSATSEWYFNVEDNSQALGPTNNSGYSVFGRVIGTGMSVVDAIAALPRYNLGGGAFATTPLRNYTGGALTDANFASVSSITVVPVYPSVDDATSVLTFAATSNNPSVASVNLAGSAVAVTPRSAGTASVTLRATDTNGNSVENTFNVSVQAGPTFTIQPESQAVNVGSAVVLNAAATGASSYQWTKNGVNIAGATASTYTIASAQPEHAGIYVAIASNGSTTTLSRPAVVGLRSTEQVVGTATQVAFSVPHPRGNIYDQVLLQGGAATVRADPGEVMRISYIDESNDIVQVEFAGPGNLTVTLDNVSGPAKPVNYEQDVNYVKGRATIVLAGANQDSNLSVFSVGRGNAVNQALFRDNVTYDGMADIARIAIVSSDGKFAGLRTANTRYSATRGLTGVYASGVDFTNAFFVGDLTATEAAIPTLSLAGSGDARLTGGDLFQENAFAIQIDGLSQLKMTAGVDSHDRQQAAQANRGRLERNGVDVTNDVIVPAN